MTRFWAPVSSKGIRSGVEAVELISDLSEGRAGQGRGLLVAVLDEQQLQEEELFEFQTESPSRSACTSAG